MFKKLSIERFTVLAAPFYAAGAAWITGLVATNVPGAPPVDPAAVQGLEASAVIGTVGVIAKWLHGRQNPLLGDLTSAERAVKAAAVKVEKAVPASKGVLDQVETLGEAEMKRVYDAVKAKLPEPAPVLAPIPPAATPPVGDFVAPAPAVSPAVEPVAAIVPGTPVA